MSQVVDMRSDLLAPRSPSVARAVADAFSVPSTLAPGEDANEMRLLSIISEMLGTEASVFLPTCTMANQIALRCWLPNGGLVAGDALAHLITVEHKALELTGARYIALSSEIGHVTPAAVGTFLKSATGSSLIWLENTHNISGGSIMPPGWQLEISRICDDAHRVLHLDGSRLWNAAASLNVDLEPLARGATSVALSLNKAVGAPMGAILAGPRDMVDRAIQFRAALSGDWRPIGPMAAGALAAIEQWRLRLLGDHETAKDLSAMLKARLGESAVSKPATNLIVLYCAEGKAEEVTALAAQRGVKVLPLGPSMIRLAIHGGVTRQSLPSVVDAMAAAWDSTI